jgi:hypothetical protein
MIKSALRCLRPWFSVASFAANITIAGATVAAAYFTFHIWQDSHFNALPQLTVTATIQPTGRRGGSVLANVFAVVKNDGDNPATNISISCYSQQLGDEPSQFRIIQESQQAIIRRLNHGNSRTFWVGDCEKSRPIKLVDGDKLLVSLCYESSSGEQIEPDNWVFRVTKIPTSTGWVLVFNDDYALPQTDPVTADYFSQLSNRTQCAGSSPPPEEHTLAP